MRILFLSLFLTFCLAASANNHYISSSGNDASNGTSASTPWQTIKKINSEFASMKPGDSILFKRGERFYGSLIISKSGNPDLPIVIGAYGSGAKPIVTGFATLKEWNSLGNGIYQSFCSSCKTNDNMVVMDGVQKAVCRYPNTGYLTYGSCYKDSSITDKELTGRPTYSGEVIIRKRDWIIDRNKIISHSGSTINYISGSSYTGMPGFGYFIQNDSLTLDTLGEWFLSSSKNMKMYFGTANPKTHTVKTSTIDTLFAINNCNYITIEDLSLEGANIAGIILTSSNYITVTHCSINFSGKNAITFVGKSSHITVSRCNINHTNNNAISTVYTKMQTYIYIGYNTITNTGIIPGMGASDDGTYNAISNLGSKAIFEYNQIDTTGYLPINFGGDSTIVRYNFINYFCFLKQDGAGIYTSGGLDSTTYKIRIVKNNIILNGIGAAPGTNSSVINQVNGIYMDDNASQVTISDNTVAYCASNGILLNGAHSITIRNNTFYDNIRGFQIGALIKEPAYNIIFKNNIIATTHKIQTITNTGNRINVCNVAGYLSFPLSYYPVGTIDSNFYCFPFSDSHFLFANRSAYNGAALKTLADWKKFTGTEANSTLLGAVSRFEYNSTSTKKIVKLDAYYFDVRAGSYIKNVAIVPHSSVILVRMGATGHKIQDKPRSRKENY